MRYLLPSSFSYPQVMLPSGLSSLYFLKIFTGGFLVRPWCLWTSSSSRSACGCLGLAGAWVLCTCCLMGCCGGSLTTGAGLSKQIIITLKQIVTPSKRKTYLNCIGAGCGWYCLIGMFSSSSSSSILCCWITLTGCGACWGGLINGIFCNLATSSRLKGPLSSSSWSSTTGLIGAWIGTGRLLGGGGPKFWGAARTRR